jgi:Domain of unknown function (DUF4440)
MSIEETEIEQVELELRVAMLASNVDVLDTLIDDQLLFIGPSGHLLSKNDDLHRYRVGEQSITQLDVLEQLIRATPSQASVSVIAFVAGFFKEQAFQGRFRYLRVWSKNSKEWRIIAGSVFPLP